MNRKSCTYLFIMVITGILACEDALEIEVPTGEPKLIVDALIRIDEGMPLVRVAAKVSVTSSFFRTVPATELEQITIVNLESGGLLILTEKEAGSGIYEELTSPDFFRDGELILQLTHQKRLYFARTRYVQTVPITSVEQGKGTFIGGDETEVIVTFMDAAERDDFYVFDFDFDEYIVTEDEFYQGQEFRFSYFYDTNLEPGDAVTICILGADEGFYNYMNQLIQQSGDQMGPFATPAATVRGNVFDVTGLDNEEIVDNVDRPDKFALGYFAVVQEYKQSITIE